MSTKPNIPVDPVSAATAKVAKRLVELCRTGKNLDAIKELYADDAAHVEAMTMPGAPPESRTLRGKPALLAKAEQFAKGTTIHSATCGDPRVNGEQFACEMALDATAKEGPMAGQRMNIQETAIYTVKNNKVAEARFFYGCPG